MSLVSGFMKGMEPTTYQTNGITIKDLASLDGSSSSYSASALSAAMMSDTSSSCSRGSYVARGSYNSTHNIIKALNKPFYEGSDHNDDLLLDDQLSCDGSQSS